MKMEVIAVQSTYGVLGSNKVRDWTSTLTPPTSAATAVVASVGANGAVVAKKEKKNNANNTNKNSINNNNNKMAKQTTTYSINKTNINNSNKPSYYQQQQKQKQQQQQQQQQMNNAAATNNPYFCDEYDIDAAAVDELSLRLLDELRAAKSRHLTCTEVSLPCDLTPSIAAEIIRVSASEPCGIRGCTIYIEFEDEPNNSRRIASLKLDPETVSTFEIYLTLRQDHRGWVALLPQFMKGLSRTITISPEYTITKQKLYSADEDMNARRSYSFSSSRAIATPST